VKEQDLGHGLSIIGFDSMEQMMAYQAQREAELAEEMKHLSEPQQSISWGSYAIRLVIDDDKVDTVVFGRVFTITEFTALELGAGAAQDEVFLTIAHLQELYARGYRYGRWFSEPFPDGEYGDAHVTDLWPITEADYQHALNNRWVPPAYLISRVLEEIHSTIRKEAEDD